MLGGVKLNNEYFGMDKKRYETRGIAEDLEVLYRFILWTLVDSLRDNKDVQMDYFQVFEFSCDTDDKTLCVSQNTYKQRIVHSQEQPEYRVEYEISVETPINGKIFVIDDGDHCTMLWADEY